MSTRARKPVPAPVRAEPVPADGQHRHAEVIWTESGLKLEVWEHGDVVRVEDTAANGHSAWVSVCHGNYSHCYTFKAKSFGDHVTRRASDGGVYNLPEGGTKISLNWNGDGGTVNSSYFRNDH
jgi:hypothetical protein